MSNSSGNHDPGAHPDVEYWLKHDLTVRDMAHRWQHLSGDWYKLQGRDGVAEVMNPGSGWAWQAWRSVAYAGTGPHAAGTGPHAADSAAEAMWAATEWLNWRCPHVFTTRPRCDLCDFSPILTPVGTKWIRDLPGIVEGNHRVLIATDGTGVPLACVRGGQWEVYDQPSNPGAIMAQGDGDTPEAAMSAAERDVSVRRKKARVKGPAEQAAAIDAATRTTTATTLDSTATDAARAAAWAAITRQAIDRSVRGIIARLIAEECDALKALLLSKNEAYGGCFARADAIEQIRVRIDDKLSRLMRGQNTEAVPEDTERDLLGYLVLLRVARKMSAPGSAGKPELKPRCS